MNKILNAIEQDKNNFLLSLNNDYIFLNMVNKNIKKDYFIMLLLSVMFVISFVIEFNFFKLINSLLYKYSLSEIFLPSVFSLFIPLLFLVFSVTEFFNFLKYDKKENAKKEVMEKYLETNFYNTPINDNLQNMLKIELSNEQYKVLKYSSLEGKITYKILINFIDNIDNINNLIKNTINEVYTLNIDNIKDLKLHDFNE